MKWLVDVLDYTPRWYQKIYTQGYLKLIEHAPDLYAMMFRKTDNPARIQELPASAANPRA